MKELLANLKVQSKKERRCDLTTVSFRCTDEVHEALQRVSEEVGESQTWVLTRLILLADRQRGEKP